MSAITGPDEYSHVSSDSPQSNEQSFDSQQEMAQYPADYVPEREFVLMPLLRRIGNLLGLRKNEEPQYVSEPESGLSAPALAPVESQESSSEIPIHAVPEPIAHPIDWQPEEPALGLHREAASESEIAPASHFENSQYEPEIETHFEPVQPSEAVEEFSPSEIQEQQKIAGPEPERNLEQSAVHSAEAISSSASRQTSSPQEELRELIAPLREAAAKISAAVAQAADWIRAKEEEIRRQAAVASTDSERNHAQAPLPILPLEAHTIAATPAEISSAADKNPQGERTTWQPMETPGLQRELAWQSRSMEAADHDSWADSNHYAARQPSVPVDLKPQLVPSIPRVPFWKRVDWAQEFTPRRVAVLGGLAMAVLLVLGVSLGRRPASSALPEPQQTRSIEPAGVTVTTHPITGQSAAPQPARAATVARPSPVAHRSPRAAAEEDDGPEVVTHYYNNGKKPSPVKQTTVAGVRHYSDM